MRQIQIRKPTKRTTSAISTVEPLPAASFPSDL